ncbi:MAG TPA: histidine phosphatase family protein [Candidatus Margulisiibacteriota bacterium]|nr:histidine phosphatase family protein [Candidatus Margulisiibacteriota bacterium]
MTRLVLVRHGETEGQSSVRYHGRTDVPLSALGRAQMACAREALADERFDAVYASTLSRSVEAAAIIAGAAATVTRVTGFDEIDFGDWEGLTAEEIRGRDPERYARWVGPRTDFAYPGGESVSAFRARVVRALHEVLAQAPPGHLLFAVHKGIIYSVLTELLQLDEMQRRTLTVPLASIHVVSRATARGNGGWRAEVLDRTDHL